MIFSIWANEEKHKSFMNKDHDVIIAEINQATTYEGIHITFMSASTKLNMMELEKLYMTNEFEKVSNWSL